MRTACYGSASTAGGLFRFEGDLGAVSAAHRHEDAYIETHLGGGAIMKRKPPALDRDAQALAEFECDYPMQRIHGCAHRFLAEAHPQQPTPPTRRDHILLELLKTLDARLEGWRT